MYSLVTTLWALFFLILLLIKQSSGYEVQELAVLILVQAIGRLIGLALRHDVAVDLPFARPVFKLMLGQTLTFEDLEEIESEFVKKVILPILETNEVHNWGLCFAKVCLPQLRHSSQ